LRNAYQYLCHNSLDNHKKIIFVYGKQKDAMLATMEKYFPQTVNFTHPGGGVLVWASLPKDKSAV
jgi:2-aminoadipate transaminase